MSLVAVHSLVDELLAEQQRLTAVERFSQYHESTHGPALAGTYESLLPLSKPGPGEQYRFEVDLDASALTQFVINLRYALMSLSLSQKLERRVGLIDRMLFSFMMTDEVFAVASGHVPVDPGRFGHVHPPLRIDAAATSSAMVIRRPSGRGDGPRPARDKACKGRWWRPPAT